MIFTKEHARMVVDRRKRQTRRPVKPGEYAVLRIGTDRILSVIGANGRLKWQLGKDYAAQPGRGKKSIGRTPRLIEIRQEMLWDISEEDARDEGAMPFQSAWYKGKFRTAFVGLWSRIYKKKPYRWGYNPEVWVLVFEPVEDFEEFVMRETEAAVEGGIIDENTGLPFELAGPGEG